MKKWFKEVDELTKEVTAGKFVNAFFISGNERGKTIQVKLKKENNSSADENSTDTDSTSSTGLKDEIARLNEKEKRSKELDEQKIWELIKKQFNPHANASLLKGEFNDVENQAAAFALYNKLNYNMKSPFCELFKIDIRNLDFSKVTDEQLRQMIRFFFLDTLPPVVLYNGYNEEALVSLNIARQYFPSVLKEVEDDQEEISSRRIAKVNAKIAELNMQIKALQPLKEKKPKKGSIKNVDC